MRDFGKLYAEIAHMAGWQQGHVTRVQLLRLGVPARTISFWVASGRLIVVHAGVYAVGYRRVEPVALAMAAVLACGDGAVLSHGSAAALWGLRKWPAQPEVIAPHDRRRPGIVGHRSRTLAAADRTRQLGVPVTRPARTLRDIRPRLTQKQFTRLVNRAWAERLFGEDDHEALLSRTHRGLTRSELEDAFRVFVGRHHLPVPLFNVRVCGDEVDVLFAPQKLIVELDGWDHHRSRTAFSTDRERDAAHLEAGFQTVRITAERVHGAPAREAARLRRILSASHGS